MLLAQDQHSSGFVTSLLVLLAAAALVTMGLRKLRFSTIPGYLITGAIIGPHALGLVRDTGAIGSISQLAIILLMFGIGMHLDIGGLSGGVVPILAVGVISTIVSTLAGWPIAMLFGAPAPAALAVCIALAMSSTAVVLRILQQRRELHRIHGRLAFGILVTQDLLAVAALAAMPLLAAWGQTEDARGPAWPGWEAVFTHVALVVGGISALIVFGKLFLPRLLQEAAKGSSDELLIVLSAAVALGAAVLTSALGFSAELGAFLAGFLLASTHFRHHLSGQLVSMRDLFMAVFFTAVGLSVDLAGVAHQWWIILLGLLILTAGKAAIITITAWAAGATGPSALVTGLSLAQAGEFSLVVLGAASAAGVIPAAERSNAIAIVVFSLILTPILIERSHEWSRRFSRMPLAPWAKHSGLRSRPLGGGAAGDGDETDSQRECPRRIIIAGFGIVGRALADRFDVLGRPYTVIELNPETVRKQKALKRSIVYGDASNPEVLETAGIRHADAVILTIPDEDATLRACRVIRALAPGVFIAARTTFLSQAMRAAQLGADHITVEEVATAEAMERHVLARLTQREATVPVEP